MDEARAGAIRSTVASLGNDRRRLLEVAHVLQARHGHLTEDDVELLAASFGIHRVEVQDALSFYRFYQLRPRPAGTIVRLSDCVLGKLAGSSEVAEALQAAAEAPFGRTSPDGRVTLAWTSCIGMCDQGPAALVDGRVLTGLTPDRARRLIELLRQAPAGTGTAAAGRDELASLLRSTVQSNLRQGGPILFGPVERGTALQRALERSPEQVVAEIISSRLRGRGGAGFPTGMKWDFCRRAPAQGPRVLVANADEGEPGTFKDRVLLTEVPDLLFEGMTVAGYALGADQGFLYLRGEYAYLRERLEQVLAERRSQGLLGRSVAGRAGFDFDIEVRLGAGAYICGEESALIESLEGKRGAPRDRPPYPVSQGYLQQPTVVNNVETLCCVARILEHGAGWFAAHGVGDSAGTKLVSVSGDCRQPGVYEIPLGLTIRQLLELAGGEDAVAVQMGGPSGRCVPLRDFGRSISFEDQPTGGAVIAFGPQRDLLGIMRHFTHFFADESCGWCTPCRVGTTLLLHQLDGILQGKGARRDLEQLGRLGLTVKKMSRCGLGQSAANPVLSTMRDFPELYEARLQDKPPLEAFDVGSAAAEFTRLTGRQPPVESPPEHGAGR